MNSQEFTAAQSAGLFTVGEHVLLHCAYGATIQGTVERYVHGAPAPVGVVLSVAVEVDDGSESIGLDPEVEQHSMLVPISQIVAVEWQTPEA